MFVSFVSALTGEDAGTISLKEHSQIDGTVPMRSFLGRVSGAALAAWASQSPVGTASGSGSASLLKPTRRPKPKAPITLLPSYEPPCFFRYFPSQRYLARARARLRAPRPGRSVDAFVAPARSGRRCMPILRCKGNKSPYLQSRDIRALRTCFRNEYSLGPGVFGARLHLSPAAIPLLMAFLAPRTPDPAYQSALRRAYNAYAQRVHEDEELRTLPPPCRACILDHVRIQRVCSLRQAYAQRLPRASGAARELTRGFEVHISPQPQASGPAGFHVAMRCRCCLKRYGRNKKQFLQSRDIRALRTCSRNAYSLGPGVFGAHLHLSPAVMALLSPQTLCCARPMTCTSRAGPLRVRGGQRAVPTG